MEEKYDFSGYATRNDLRCSDGRTIKKDAFKDNDGKTVPLVWQHRHDEPSNVLGHALLQNRPDGVYTYGKFNDTEMGLTAKALVEHGDITSLSIYANHLTQKGGDVWHGDIKEVSLVLAGANPGAFIEFPSLQHGEDADNEEEAIIYTGETMNIGLLEDQLNHAEENSSDDEVKGEAKVADNKEKTVQDVFDELTEEQKNVVYFIIGEALKEAENSSAKHDDFNGGNDMHRNVFDSEEEVTGGVLSHDDMKAIFDDAKRMGSLKDSILAHAEDYGIDNIDYLFPDAQAISDEPDFIKRQDEYVTSFLSATHHTPFSRIKSLHADITEDDARARGYMKGNRKTNEVFALLKRVTNPQTIYKKQKLDRDDLVDITSFNVVAWLKKEMRGMLNEELVRAALVGDGRSDASDDKINPLNIRPIWTDDDLYTVKKVIEVSSYDFSDNESAIAKAFIRGVVKSRKDYRGSGTPILYTTDDILTDCLLMEDNDGRIIYDTIDKLKTALRVKDIVTAPILENQTRVVNGQLRTLAAIIVNPADYTFGSDRGGEISFFDDFDIDYNQQKYLIETRTSGALTKPYSAIAVEFAAVAGVTITPPDPTDEIGEILVGARQANVVIDGNGVSGTLHYITGNEGYSQNPAEQEGNFLVLDFQASEYGAVKARVVPGMSNYVDVITEGGGSDPAEFRITNPKRQNLEVLVYDLNNADKHGFSTKKSFDLSGLTLEKA